MTEETIKILRESISDVGYWRWWVNDNDIYQVEFGGVQLFDETKKEKEGRSSVIAIRFSGNSFIIFLDNMSDLQLKKDWYDKLHNDQIEPFNIEHEEFTFNDLAYTKQVYDKYQHRNFIPNTINIETIKNKQYVLTVKCNEVAFIIGGDEISIIGSNGNYSEEEIKEKYEKWWSYWKEYWNVRETEHAYQKDYVCEVTIPIKQ